MSLARDDKPQQPDSDPRQAANSRPAGPDTIRRVALGLLYLIALSVLVLWEYRDRLESLSSNCELRDQVKSSLFNKPYERLLHWASSGAIGHVVTLAIPLELEDVQNNICTGRDYMADVLLTLAPSRPAVVVVDKFYSAGACVASPATTQALIQAVRSLPMPVVVGESTNGLEHQQSSSCLVRKSQLDFGAANVLHGVTRLNSEPERLPLRWLVLPFAAESADRKSEPGAPQAEKPIPEFADSLSMAAVKAYRSNFAEQNRITQLIERDDHGYANVALALPSISTTQLLCAANDEHLRQKWALTCSSRPLPVDLAGKIVVIGAETLNDQKIVLDQRVWGFQLQAQYMEALLSGDYLRFLPMGWGLVIFALFIFLIEGLPTILIARRPAWRTLPFLRYAYPHRRYIWVFVWSLATIALSGALTLALRFLPPLLVYGDILLVTITRLLIFLAESAEDPFLHAHGHRKEHHMSNPIASEQTSSFETPVSTDSSESHTNANLAAKAEPTAWVPDQVDEPMPTPVSTNKPGTEGGTVG